MSRVRPSGSLYVQLLRIGGPIRKYQHADRVDAGSLPANLAESATGLAGESGGDVFLIDQGTTVAEFNADGDSSRSTNRRRAPLRLAVGVTGTRGRNVYATTQTDSVTFFGPPRIVPSRRSDPARSSSTASSSPDVHSSADFQVDADGGYAAFPSARADDRLRISASIARSTATTRGSGESTAPPASRPSARRSTADTRCSAYGSSLDRRRPGLLQHARAAGPARHQRKRDAYEWSNGGRMQLISPGHQPVRLRACSRSAATAPTPSSSPATSSSRGRQRQRDEDLRRPRRRRLLHDPGTRRPAPPPTSATGPAARRRRRRAQHLSDRPRAANAEAGRSQGLPQGQRQEEGQVREEAGDAQARSAQQEGQRGEHDR